MEKASRGLVELISALNFDHQEVALGLFRLYQYCLDNIKKSNYGEAISIIEELKASWVATLDKKIEIPKGELGIRLRGPKLKARGVQVQTVKVSKGKTTVAEKGLEISVTITPIIPVFLDLKLLAGKLSTYPRSSAIRSILFLVLGLMSGLSFKARETVFVETFATLAKVILFNFTSSASAEDRLLMGN